jgi:hypothetical protein
VYQLVRLYEESAEVARDRAPDRRVFALETGAGLVRPIRGYRGDGRPSKRRGLPSYDARMLVSTWSPALAAACLWTHSLVSAGS